MNKDFSKVFAMEDKLIDTIVKILNLHWIDEDGSIPYLLDKDGEVFGADECDSVPIPDTKVTFKNGESFICDSVVFFGDGCTEFHDKESMEAFNWCEFTEDSCIRVTDEIVKIFEKK